ncbi:uncharacterized protein rab11fip5a isoform X1 [Astyanax mexicanus]|uniref:uncharacterized protein rab11fip5a isoform X1 n=2 Tax=Astyanax mexicanus TaxID=7994 RepID=UPI0020CAB011|nr:uncharacterized protein rab11fip5a isoform X1 [Astyanax mexicanus]
MCSVNAADEEQRWVPTHVQVLVIRARGLRAKGKHGTSDAYTLMQLGKEKYSTCVVEKSTAPEWSEECSFELQPGVLEEGGRDACAPGSCDLTLTVMHRALIGLDVFLGQAVIPLDKAFSERICMKNEWYKLHSKTEKKVKERGELQVTVQFTRHNLTASMYDLSKPRSAFGKLRERMRAKKRSADEESSSAIVPGGYGALARMRGRLPSDGGGEEDYEDDEGGELRRSKMRSFFLRGRLRKSSDTRSSTSLGSESSESSSRGGSLSPTAGISVVVSDLSNSPSNSSNLTADNSPEHTVAPSPQVSPVKHAFDEPCDNSIPVPNSLTNDNDFHILLPSVCVNGNPVETSPLTHQPPTLILQQPKPQPQTQQEPTRTPPQTSSPEKKLTRPHTAKPQVDPQTQLPKVESKPKLEPKLSGLGLLQKGSALSLSLQNLSRRGEERKGGGPIDGRRWSFDRPGDEEKAAIAAALENAGLITDEPEVEAMTVSETEVPSKKKRGLFSHGRGGESAGKGSGTGKEETGHGQPPTEGKHRGWFSSKDSKPSQLLALQDSSPSKTKPPSTLTLTDPSQGTAHQYTNPFTSPPLLSPANPFFSHLQQNPFFQDLCTVTLTPALPSLFSPDCTQSTAPSFSTSNYTSPSGLHEAGHTNGHSVNNKASEMAIKPKDIHISDECGLNPDWDNFLSNTIKPSKPPPLIKPPDPTPSGGECGLTLSNISNTTPACTFPDTLDSSNTILHPSANSICWRAGDTDLNSSPAQEALVSDFDSSLPQNSSIEFSELNTLACPYPSISVCSVNQDSFSAVSDRENFVVEPQITSLCSDAFSALSLSFVSSEVSPFGNKSLDSLWPEVGKKTKHELVKCPSSEMLIDDTDKSVETLKSKGLSSEESLEPTIITSDSPDYQTLESSHLQTRTDHLKFNKSTTNDKGNVGVVDLKECVVKDETHLHGLSVPAGTRYQSVLNATAVVEEKDAEGEPGCIMSLDKTDASPVKDGSLIDNLEVIMTSSPGVSSNIQEDISDWPPDPCRGNLRVDIEQLTVETPFVSRQTPSVGYLHPLSANVSMETEPSALIAALSPGSQFFHSLYTSVDSEQYVTCRSLHSSLSTHFQEPEPEHDAFQEAKPKESQGVLPVNDLLQKNMSEIESSQKTPEVFQKTDNVRNGFQFDPLNPPVCHESMPNFNTSKKTLLKCDLIDEAVGAGMTNEANERTVDMMLNHNLKQEEKKVTPLKKMTRTEEEYVKSDPQLCLVNTQTDLPESHLSHDVRHDTAHGVQPAENLNDTLCDLLSEPSSSITQDLVTTDLLLEKIFVPGHNAASTIKTVAVEHSQTKNSDKNSNTQEATAALRCTESLYLDNCKAKPPLPEPSSIEQPTLPHSLLWDLLPLASSTPDIVVGTNTLSSFPFPKMPPTPANSSQSTVLAAALLPPTQLVSHAPLPQETHQVPTPNSPHPVKPLTPPDEKRSEGRSVLEKLKSTIHPGRSHHGDQDSEKKALVEGGGSYYHLNHSELVSLLLQRDAELQQEKEEYERRGMLLEKREVEIKKMKVIIRDLEDYIDTLLVRIMEQTPTLLQVRSKMK